MSRYYGRVRCALDDGAIAASATAASFTTGLLSPPDWKAQWIRADPAISAPLFRKEFKLPTAKAAASVSPPRLPHHHGFPTSTIAAAAAAASASAAAAAASAAVSEATAAAVFAAKGSAPAPRVTLFVAGIGYNEVYLNGAKLGDHKLDSGWTDFKKRALYTTYDLTGLVKPSGAANALGVWLGNGWWSCGPPPGTTQPACAKDPPQLRLQLQVDDLPLISP